MAERRLGGPSERRLGGILAGVWAWRTAFFVHLPSALSAAVKARVIGLAFVADRTLMVEDRSRATPPCRPSPAGALRSGAERSTWP